MINIFILLDDPEDIENINQEQEEGIINYI
jgi:hypothetical protein